MKQMLLCNMYFLTFKFSLPFLAFLVKPGTPAWTVWLVSTDREDRQAMVADPDRPAFQAVQD
jgi:hypothetical protein